MQIKVNMECALKILEKHGFDVNRRPEEGGPIEAKREVNGEDKEKVELFQVYCGAPYVKFEATMDQEAQRSILEAMNHGLENLIKNIETPKKDEKSATPI